MDLKRLIDLATDLRRTRAELEQMKANALSKGNIEAAKIVNEVLLQRFPVRSKSGGGKTPTEVRFKGRAEIFESGKEGYLWLVEQFRARLPGVLDEYVKLQVARRTTTGGSRFARSPTRLFPKGSKRGNDPKHYASLTGGWYADININHDDKFAALLQLSHLAGLEYATDWEFRPVGSTDRLREHQEGVLRAKELALPTARAQLQPKVSMSAPENRQLRCAEHAQVQRSTNVIDLDEYVARRGRRPLRPWHARLRPSRPPSVSRRTRAAGCASQ